LCVSLAADALGLTAHDNYELAVRALGACTWYLKESFLDQQLLSMGRFEVYRPQDLVGTVGPTLTVVSKPSFTKHMASIGSYFHKLSCRFVIESIVHIKICGLNFSYYVFIYLFWICICSET
jgi:hypothetical protein